MSLTSLENFEEVSLPKIKAFDNQRIIKNDYNKCANEVWDIFTMKNLCDYLDLNLMSHKMSTCQCT